MQDPQRRIIEDIDHVESQQGYCTNLLKRQHSMLDRQVSHDHPKGNQDEFIPELGLYMSIHPLQQVLQLWYLSQKLNKSSNHRLRDKRFLIFKVFYQRIFMLNLMSFESRVISSQNCSPQQFVTDFRGRMVKPSKVLFHDLLVKTGYRIILIARLIIRIGEQEVVGGFFSITWGICRREARGCLVRGIFHLLMAY